MDNVALVRRPQDLAQQSTIIPPALVVSASHVTQLRQPLPFCNFQHVDELGSYGIVDERQIAEQQKSRVKDCTSQRGNVS